VEHSSNQRAELKWSILRRRRSAELKWSILRRSAELKWSILRIKERSLSGEFFEEEEVRSLSGAFFESKSGA
jgi:hypothetical protein